jgi:hypothetical protein
MTDDELRTLCASRGYALMPRTPTPTIEDVAAGFAGGTFAEFYAALLDAGEVQSRSEVASLREFDSRPAGSRWRR